MPEFRYQGVNLSGKLVRGVLFTTDKKEAKRRIEEIASSRKFRVTAIQKRGTFTFKVQKGMDKPVLGEQKAFSKGEVEAALRKMGYRVIRVQKKLLDFNMKPPADDVMLFIRLSADLLAEKLPYDEVLQLLASDAQSRAMKDTIGAIREELREGKDGKEVFAKHEHALGKFTAYMLGVASKSGNMAEIYESTAKFIERDRQFKKDMKSSLVMPLATVFLLLAAVAYYVMYIFPETALMFAKFGVDLPPLTQGTLDLSEFLKHNMLFFLIGFSALAALAIGFLRSSRGRMLVDKHLIRVPVVGSLFHKTSIEIFSRVFYALYSGSGENMEAIQVAADACRNKYIEHQIKNVALPMMLRDGMGLVESLAATKVFPENAISRFRSGAETGTIRKTALQLAEYYEKETSYRMKTVIDFVNVLISMFIMVVMIALTIVSSETATMSPPTPGMR
ncbi:MAG: type II secretion system F family protein [Candidatus Latescibacterota bacterium]